MTDEQKQVMQQLHDYQQQVHKLSSEAQRTQQILDTKIEESQRVRVVVACALFRMRKHYHAPHLKQTLTESIEWYTAQVEHFKAARAEHRATVESCKTQLAEVTARLQDKEQQLHNAHASLETLRDEHLQLKTQATAQQKDMATLQASFDAAQHTLAQYQERVAARDKEIVSMQHTIDGLQAMLDDTTSKYVATEDTLQQRTKQLVDQEDIAQRLEAQLQITEDQVHIVQTQLRDAGNEVCALKHQLEECSLTVEEHGCSIRALQEELKHKDEELAEWQQRVRYVCVSKGGLEHSYNLAHRHNRAPWHQAVFVRSKS